MQQLPIVYPTDWLDYELVDSGQGKKLERFGHYTIIRPDPRVLWDPHLPTHIWQKANATYRSLDHKSGEWQLTQPLPSPWQITYRNLNFKLRTSDFKHVGIFPEQAVNWHWLSEQINNPLNILNLFGYTGGATMAAAKSGAQVTHVDSAKGIIGWAKENATLSNLSQHQIRWIEDDAYKFVNREVRRGKKYDGIIMDPPRFRHGTKGEIWKLAQNLPKLLHVCQSLFSQNFNFLLINIYTADISAIVLQNLLIGLMKNLRGHITIGELALKESKGGRLLPSGIFARWTAKPNQNYQKILMDL